MTNKEKIGILTFHRAINYGAFLQAYALKTHLISQGYDVSIIDYWPRAHENIYKLFTPNWRNHSFKRNIIYPFLCLLGYYRASKRKKKMNSLFYYYFNISILPRYESPESLKTLYLDCIIYGSDQIWWNSKLPNYKGFDPVYWGEFVDHSIKKITYAPSMGVIDINNKEEQTIKSFLKNFKYISVRESNFKNAITSLTEKEIAVVLDPVFLLSKEQWDKICTPIHRKKYILYYNLLKSTEADKLVNKLKQELHCGIVEITGKVYPLKMGKRYIQTADAIEFISLIKNADFVVTTSFHGTAFSIIFEKQFYALGMGNNSGRVKSLLEILGIENRLLKDSSNLDNSYLDYSSIRERLQLAISDSKKYLKVGLS